MEAPLTRILGARGRLLARIEMQRASAARYGNGLKIPAAAIDKLSQVGRSLREHPSLLLLAAGAAVLVRARSVAAATAGLAGVWRLASRARGLLRKFS